MHLIENKKAHFEYEIEDTFCAGVQLLGSEVKSVRLGHGSLQGSFVKIVNGQAFLLNAQINQYAFSADEKYDPKRTRKLLLKKHELLTLSELTHNKGKTLVALSFSTLGRHIKLVVGVGKGRKQFEKRAHIREREESRRIQKEFQLR